jgi:hypothetical protein
MGREDLVTGESLPLFFYEQIEAAQEQRGETLPPEVAAYVVNLLAAFTLQTAAAGRTSPPFAIQYLQAQDQGPTALRAVGDRALFVAGVVPHSLDRSPVNVGYVRTIGEDAYRGVYARVRNLVVFEELANHFGQVLDVLGDLAAAHGGQSVATLLNLYGRWREHGSKDDAQRLRKAGVRLDQTAKKVLH